MSDPFTATVLAGHESIRQRIDATAQVAFPRQARDHQQRVDAVLITACRHVVAVNCVLVNELRRRDEPMLADLIATECTSVQLALLRAKGRLYGAAQLATVPWHRVWNQVVDHLEDLTRLEVTAVAQLVRLLGEDDLQVLAQRLCRAEERAPTRPHPFLARHHVSGRLALAVWARADAIWDTFEGRCAPAVTPIRTSGSERPRSTGPSHPRG